MHEPLGAVERIRLPQVREILGVHLRGDVQRRHANPVAHGEGALVRRRALRPGRHRAVIVQRDRRRRGGQRGTAGRASHALAVHLQDQGIAVLGRGHLSDRILVDRLGEARLPGAALEPGAAPTLHRQVGHVAIDVDAAHEAALEPELLGGGIVVDLVLRGLGRVVR